MSSPPADARSHRLSPKVSEALETFATRTRRRAQSRWLCISSSRWRPSEQESFVSAFRAIIAVFIDDCDGFVCVLPADGEIAQILVPRGELEISRHVVRFIVESCLQLLEGAIVLPELKVSVRHIFSGEWYIRIDCQKLKIILNELFVNMGVVFSVSSQ